VEKEIDPKLKGILASGHLSRDAGLQMAKGVLSGVIEKPTMQKKFSRKLRAHSVTRKTNANRGPYLPPGQDRGLTREARDIPFTKTQVAEDKISYWQLILLQSQANGCFYHGDDLPYNIWAWPRKTWFQERLSHHLKDLEIAAHHAKN
jgi:hypothetical protein